MAVRRMDVIERGTGQPLVLVPGVQGRWEYMRPAVDALAEHFRVLTFSLAGERTSGRAYDRTRGFDDLADQVETVLDTRGIPAALICGVSFGGLVALRFAATRPRRTAALALVSTPTPGWHLRRRHEFYARLPWLFGPLFLAETPFRLRDELKAAMPVAADRRRFRREQLLTFLEAPVSASRMATRARLISQLDAAAQCQAVASPTLVLTGEPGLDHVINGDGGSAYARLIDNARTTVLERTGHLGLVTRPQAFALTIKTFADDVLAGGCAKTTHDAA